MPPGVDWAKDLSESGSAVRGYALSMKSGDWCLHKIIRQKSLKEWNRGYTSSLIMRDEVFLYMMPGSKGLNPHELAHKWMKDLGTRPNMSLKVG